MPLPVPDVPLVMVIHVLPSPGEETHGTLAVTAIVWPVTKASLCERLVGAMARTGCTVMETTREVATLSNTSLAHAVSSCTPAVALTQFTLLDQKFVLTGRFVMAMEFVPRKNSTLFKPSRSDATAFNGINEEANTCPFVGEMMRILGSTMV